MRLSIRQLVNHPANPDPSEAEIAETATWLESRGQEEPLVVRELPDSDRYEVLAGKRRLAAATRLGWSTIECRVRRDLDSDAAAVAFIAASNAQRHAETPIRQALMIKAMFDRGYTLKQAGAIYGLQTEPAVRNKLQLLKLPEAWQQRIVSGEISESSARCLVPYCDYPTVMQEIEREYRSDKASEFGEENWSTRERFEDCVESIVTLATRPVEKGNRHNYGPALGWSHDCYIRLTPELEKELQVVELPLGKNGKLVRRAVNVERYDELQVPLIEKRLAKKAGRSQAGSDGPRADKPRTAAEEKALRAEQAAQLAKRIARWRHAWLRELIAERLRQKVPDHPVLIKLVLWCLGQHFSFHAHNQLRFDQLIIESTEGRTHASSHELLAVLSPSTCTLQRLLDVVTTALVTHERQPDFPVWTAELVESLAADLQIDLADAWLVLQSAVSIGKVSPERMVSFYELHNGAQLDDLGSELGVYVKDTKGRAGKIKLLTSQPRILPLPKSVSTVGRAK